MIYPLPPGPFKVCYADPCWSYGRTTGQGIARKEYDTLSYRDLCSIPVADAMNKDAMLFLWGTWPKLCDGEVLGLIEAWGFRPVTCAFLWVKTNRKGPGFFFGTGWYMKANSEFCMLGVRGKPWKISDRLSQIVEAESPEEIWTPVTKHSEKPRVARERIVEFCGDVPRLEMFSRHQNPGWTSWGAEVPTAYQMNLGDTSDQALSPTWGQPVVKHWEVDCASTALVVD